MRMKKVVALAVVSMAMVGGLSGCSHGTQALASENQQSLESKLVRGKTTKAEVQALFGEPAQKSNRAAGESWLYTSNEMSAKTFVPFLPIITGDYGTKMRNLEINFNKKGVVADYEFGVRTQ